MLALKVSINTDKINDNIVVKTDENTPIDVFLNNLFELYYKYHNHIIYNFDLQIDSDNLKISSDLPKNINVVEGIKSLNMKKFNTVFTELLNKNAIKREKEIYTGLKFGWVKNNHYTLSKDFKSIIRKPERSSMNAFLNINIANYNIFYYEIILEKYNGRLSDNAFGITKYVQPDINIHSSMSKTRIFYYGDTLKEKDVIGILYYNNNILLFENNNYVNKYNSEI